MAASAWTPVPADQASWTPVAKEEPKQQGFLGSFSDASGLTSLGNAVAHPIDTIMGIPASVKGAVSNTVDNVKQGVSDYQKEGLTDKTRRDFGRAVPIVGPALAAAQSQHDAGNNLGMVGTLAGTVAGLAAPEALKGAGEAFPGAIRTTGDALETAGSKMQDAGVKRINTTVGALQADFKHGSNLGRGYLENNIGPSASMRSIANKADTALESVGEKLSDAYSNASAKGPRIPVEKVEAAIAQPLKEARDLESGFGGGGNTAPLDDYAARARPALDAARANGGFTPKELFDLKQSLTKNINWKSDSQATLNGVREKQYGAITGLLTEAVPETGPLNKAYSDLATLKKRASIRADTGSTPLTNFREKGIAASIGTGAGAVSGGPAGALVGGATGLALDSIPVKTGIGSGLYGAGKGLQSAGSRLSRFGDVAGGLDAGGIPETPSNLGQQNGSGSGAGGNNQFQGNPPNGLYGTTNVIPEIINPAQMSQSRVGLGTNGRGGQIIRPMGLLPAPPEPAPQAIPYVFTPKPTTAVPAVNPASRLPTVPNSVYGDVFSGGTEAEKAAALRQAQLGSLGNTVPRGQFASPEVISPPLKGQAKWAQLGLGKILDHINREPNSDLSVKDINDLQHTVRGKSLLIQASDLKPGGIAMKNLVKQINGILGH